MTCEKCPHCPLAGQNAACRGQGRHKRFCELVNPAASAYNPAYLSRASVASGQESPLTVIPVAGTLGLIARMKKCPSWEASSSCGCGQNKCRQDKGLGGIVVHADCFACLREQDALTEGPRPSTEGSGS